MMFYRERTIIGSARSERGDGAFSDHVQPLVSARRECFGSMVTRILTAYHGGMVETRMHQACEGRQVQASMAAPSASCSYVRKELPGWHTDER